MQDKLEQYFRKNYKHVSTHNVFVRIDDNDEVLFSIEPESSHGDRLHYKVKDNKLIPMFDITDMR